MAFASSNREGDAYAIPRPSGRIKLKETSGDVASRIYAREQRRFQRQQERIARVNGLPFPRPRSRSTSPLGVPRTDIDGGVDWASGSARRAGNRKQRMEEEEIWMEEDISRPWAAWEFSHSSGTADPTIPARYRTMPPSSTFQFTHSASGSSFTFTHTESYPQPRTAFREVHLSGGVAPSMGSMTPDEYAQWLREGFAGLQNRAEMNEREKRRWEQTRQEQERVIREEQEEKQRQRRERRAEKRRMEETVRIVEDGKSAKRARYVARWKAITTTGGEIEETNITFDDIPWPVYDTASIDKPQVKEFMVDMARQNGEDVKKTLRETIRAFHPDRFFGRILPRVRPDDRERVKEAVESCSRIINALAGEL